MLSILSGSSRGEVEDWDELENRFEEEENTDRDVIADQFEYADEVDVYYPDGRSVRWKKDIEERYRTLASSFGEVEECMDLGVKDMEILVSDGRSNEPLFYVHADLGQYYSSSQRSVRGEKTTV